MMSEVKQWISHSKTWRYPKHGTDKPTICREWGRNRGWLRIQLRRLNWCSWRQMWGRKDVFMELFVLWQTPESETYLEEALAVPERWAGKWLWLAISVASTSTMHSPLLTLWLWNRGYQMKPGKRNKKDQRGSWSLDWELSEEIQHEGHLRRVFVECEHPEAAIFSLVPSKGFEKNGIKSLFLI